MHSAIECPASAPRRARTPASSAGGLPVKHRGERAEHQPVRGQLFSRFPTPPTPSIIAKSSHVFGQSCKCLSTIAAFAFSSMTRASGTSCMIFDNGARSTGATRTCGCWVRSSSICATSCTISRWRAASASSSRNAGVFKCVAMVVRVQADHAHAVILGAAFHIIPASRHGEIDRAAGAEHRVLAGAGELAVHARHVTTQQAFERAGPRFRDTASGQALNECPGVFSREPPKWMRAEVHMAVGQFHRLGRMQR
jgi:hypothetical protein